MNESLAAGVRRGALECLPKWLICVPLVLQWLWLSLRYWSATLPSAANPAITAGGLVDETKLEYFRGMGALALAATARYCALPPACQNPPGLRAAMAGAGLEFPLVVKPDLGMCGFGVRLVRDEADLMAYLAAFPRGQQLVLQEYLPQQREAGIFYARHPGDAQGRISLLAAFRIVFAKQRVLFEIGAANRRRGHQPIGLRRLAQLHCMQQRLLDACPPSN